MSPNPSKVMAPVQMQSSPIQTHTKDQLIVIAKGNRLGREKAGRVKGKIKDKEHVQSLTPSIACSKAGLGRMSPKGKSPQNVCKPSSPTSSSGTKVKGKSGSTSPVSKQEQGHYNGRSSISPDGSYAGAKFSEAPTPDLLPMPPPHWLSSFSSGKKVKSCPQPQACKTGSGHSSFDMITKDLKMMLKVES